MKKLFGLLAVLGLGLAAVPCVLNTASMQPSEVLADGPVAPTEAQLMLGKDKDHLKSYSELKSVSLGDWPLGVCLDYDAGALTFKSIFPKEALKDYCYVAYEGAGPAKLEVNVYQSFTDGKPVRFEGFNEVDIYGKDATFYCSFGDKTKTLKFGTKDVLGIAHFTSIVTTMPNYLDDLTVAGESNLTMVDLSGKPKYILNNAKITVDTLGYVEAGYRQIKNNNFLTVLKNCTLDLKNCKGGMRFYTYPGKDFIDDKSILLGGKSLKSLTDSNTLPGYECNRTNKMYYEELAITPVYVPIYARIIDPMTNDWTIMLMMESFKVGSLYTLPNYPEIPPEAYYFDNWDLGMVGEEVTITDITYLNPEFTRDDTYDYTVNFIGGEFGEGTMSTEHHSYDADFIVPNCGFTSTDDNYVFYGWNVKYDFFNVDPDSTYPGAVLKIRNCITLEAVWTEVSDTWVGFYTYLDDETPKYLSYTAMISPSESIEAPEYYGALPAGKVFDCWRDASGTYPTDVNACGTIYYYPSSMYFEAVFIDALFDVTFYANGGSGTKDKVIVKDNKYTLPDNPFTAPYGKTFVGWALGASNGPVYDASAVISMSKDIKLYAVWDDTELVTVSYADGISGMYYIQIPTDTDHTILTFEECGFSAPVGKEFDRWVDNYEHTTFHPGDTKTILVDEYEPTYIARFKDVAETCTVTFDANGGSGEMANLTVIKGDKYALPANPFTKADVIFRCWTILGEEYQPGDIIQIEGTTDIAATWDAVEALNVSYPDGFIQKGSKLDINELKVEVVYESGKTVELPLGDNLAWKVTTSDDITTDVDPKTFVFTIEGDTLLKVTTKIGSVTYSSGTHFNVTEFTNVNFIANGGSGSKDSLKVALGEYELPACPFEAPEGKIFAGWKIGNDVKQAGDTVTLTGSEEKHTLNLVATWKVAPIIVSDHQVTFSANGGEGTMDSVVAGEGFTFPECTFTPPEGKRFHNWAIYGTPFNVGDTIDVIEDADVIAEWIELDRVMLLTPEQAKDGYTVSELFNEAKTEDQTVTIFVNQSQIHFDKDAVDAIAGKDATLTFTLSDDASAYDVENAKAVINLSLSGATFASGLVTVTIPFTTDIPEGTTAKIYYLDNGQLYDMDGVFFEGKASFNTNHFSTFLVVFLEPEPPVSSSSSSEESSAASSQASSTISSEASSSALSESTSVVPSSEESIEDPEGPTSDPSTSFSPTPASSEGGSGDSSNGGLGGGAIAGIVIGAIALLGALGVGGYFLYKKLKAGKSGGGETSAIEPKPEEPKPEEPQSEEVSQEEPKE